MRHFFDFLNLVARRCHRAFNPVSEARRSGVTIGNDCRLINVKFGSEPYLITIGDHVSITSSEFVTHDGGVWVFRQQEPDIDVVAPIKVGNNVFIGLGCIILPGVTIGDNVVIGAGAVVSRNIPSNVVAVGIPAKPICTLDEYKTSVDNEKLLTKQMDQSAKRAYFLEHFRRRSE